ncbi:uncharacterized protein LY89DRAFT_716565 [Mollisia scopiformis]|uniref:Uncharacterized protein n=1 Tax=Mollisia scopiformis TaxID=149040 RepID=A0A194XJ20_MOLSC|nr:uncharacterized protein LY89DRAFT_716565 [Mollisia scopiformis]KUJ20119.1 hypothetical protein LY89DRAFT_716565 [Mollisia scopiformis]
MRKASIVGRVCNRVMLKEIFAKLQLDQVSTHHLRCQDFVELCKSKVENCIVSQAQIMKTKGYYVKKEGRVTWHPNTKRWLEPSWDGRLNPPRKPEGPNYSTNSWDRNIHPPRKSKGRKYSTKPKGLPIHPTEASAIDPGFLALKTLSTQSSSERKDEWEPSLVQPSIDDEYMDCSYEPFFEHDELLHNFSVASALEGYINPLETNESSFAADPTFGVSLDN